MAREEVGQLAEKKSGMSRARRLQEDGPREED